MQNATGMEPEKSISNLYVDICKVIEKARSFVAQTTNSSLTLMYWQIGKVNYLMMIVPPMENKLCRSWRPNYKCNLVSVDFKNEISEE
jgi:hypothetical protein